MVKDRETGIWLKRVTKAQLGPSIKMSNIKLKPPEGRKKRLMAFQLFMDRMLVPQKKEEYGHPRELLVITSDQFIHKSGRMKIWSPNRTIYRIVSSTIKQSEKGWTAVEANKQSKILKMLKDLRKVQQLTWMKNRKFSKLSLQTIFKGSIKSMNQLERDTGLLLDIKMQRKLIVQNRNLTPQKKHIQMRYRHN